MDYAREKSWHGLSCPCGGGYRVGHAIGCEYATAKDNLGQLESDLARAEAQGDHAEAAEIAARQKSPDDVMRARANAWAAHEARTRQRRADQWRRARRQIDAMPPRQRRRVRAAWDGAPYPADPVYLLDFLHSLEAGRIALDALPFTTRRVNPRGHANMGAG